MITIRNKRTGELKQVDERDLPNYRLAQTTPTEIPVTPNRSLLESLLPLLGGLGGAAVGTLGGPVGVIGGGAVGSGLGESLAQLLNKEKFNLGSVAKETAIGGVGGAVGEGFKALKVARAARAGAKAVGSLDDLAKLGVSGADDAGNILQRTGKGIVSGPYENTAVKVLKGKNIAPRAKDIAGTSANFTGSAKAKLAQLSKEREVLTNSLKTLTTGKVAQSTPVVGTSLLDDVVSEVSRTADVTTGIGKSNLTFWGEKIARVKNIEELGEVNKELLIKMQGTSGDKKNILLSIQRVVGDTLKKEMPSTEPIFDSLSRLNAAEPVIQKKAGAQWTVPFTNIGVNTSGPQSAMDKLGRLVGGAGDLAAKSPLTGAQIGGQVGLQTIDALSGDGGYQAPPTTQPGMDQYSTQEEPTSGIDVTKEQVVLARLTLPKAKADAVEAAYNLLHGDGEDTKSTEAQIARKQSKSLTSQALMMLASNPNIKTGMIGGPLENIKAKFSAGDQPSIEFNTLISNLTATIAKARAGTSFTPNEEKMLKRYSPAVGDSRQELLTKLSLLNAAWEK